MARPELLETREMGGDVETQGELTLDATVFDRRQAGNDDRTPTSPYRSTRSAAKTTSCERSPKPPGRVDRPR